MKLDYDFVEAAFLYVNEDGSLKIPERFLKVLNANPGEKMQVISVTDCIIIERKQKPPVTYLELMRK